MAGGAAGAFASVFIPTGGHPEGEHMFGWALVGSMFGAMAGAAIGAGTDTCPKPTGTLSGGCVPLPFDPRFP
jgi:hypothetical protein